MQLIPLKSQKIESGDNLLQSFLSALESANESVGEGDIIVIASKVLAFSQGRLVESADIKELVKKEADVILDEGEMVITLKNKILIPNAGIDNSNTPDGQAVLWPDDPFGSARGIRKELIGKFNLKNLGVLITDSHCQPLRAGTTGIAIGWAGFEGVQDEIGKKDLFGRPMVYTKIAIADDLASAANLLMGETDASIPFVIVRDLNITFTDKEFSEDDYFIGPEECIYKGFYGKKL
ncbi:coenzyme F420-0:L-glutamate ligase [Patescibacteria group bacterium]|nr:coenzyme F420-0:L-glutamate ligase [Patescibacteria group bacterium]MBU1682427.1 coenzyme F420-0:L-glutamate ligase [Patescibacteria group bacterium]MBU1934864.1 coenzyme F420-0:L-glutamate ligase [Patescibacteria group bacterium]